MAKAKAKTTAKAAAKTPETNTGLIIGLVVVAIIAIGGLVYLSGGLTSEDTSDADQTNIRNAALEDLGLEPGNPVVANVSGTEITRNDVFSYIQTLPPQTQQMPLLQLFPLALDQLVNQRLTQEKAKSSSLQNDPEILKRLDAIKEELVTTAYLQKTINDQLTDERLQQAYESYAAAYVPVEEARASHILVEDESTAKDLLSKLKAGADFATLAQENSLDKGSAVRGGDIGYFTAADVVPVFGEAAFTMEIDTLSSAPVQSQFGYHIIKLMDKRMRPQPSFEQARAFLEGQVRQAILQQTMMNWRKDASIEVLDINGKPIEPAAGDEAPAQEAPSPEAGAAAEAETTPAE